jgi:hypothetical protein
MENHFLLPQSKFEELTRRLDELENLLKNQKESIRLGDWVPEAEAQKMLGLKATSLWALRRHKKIRSSKIGCRTFYSLSSIERFLEKNRSK